ncbi:MAG TPA: hypothetical protein VMA72_04935 [Streptosporangiaceae bacterium]|nr:hypothetical protein [Streptosporangiaceae bacterium]
MPERLDYTWLSYAGTARVGLAIVLVAVAVVTVYAGTRLHRPVLPPKPSAQVKVIIVVGLGLAIAAFLVCLTEYADGLRRHNLLRVLPKDPSPIAPVTAVCAIAIFVAINFLTRSQEPPVRVASGLIGAMVAPMIFEFPFDLIVMTRVYPPIPPDPSLYRVMFFAPLFLTEFLTLSLLSLVPTARLTRPTFLCFALMLLVFAAWALAGFGFPATAGSYAFNAVSKIIAFVTALTLFIPSPKPL